MLKDKIIINSLKKYQRKKHKNRGSNHIEKEIEGGEIIKTFNSKNCLK
jgi:hypothetical protein